MHVNPNNHNSKGISFFIPKKDYGLGIIKYVLNLEKVRKRKT